MYDMPTLTIKEDAIVDGRPQTEDWTYSVLSGGPATFVKKGNWVANTLTFKIDSNGNLIDMRFINLNKSNGATTSVLGMVNVAPDSSD